MSHYDKRSKELINAEDLDPTLPQVVASIEDARMKKKLQVWLQTFDLAKIQSFRELAKAYQGVFLLTANCGHAGPGVRRTCEILLKCLMGYQTAYKEFLQYEFPKELMEEVREEMDKYQEALKQVLSADDYAKLTRILQSTRIED